MMMMTNKINGLSIDLSTVLLKKAMLLVDSKYMIHIKTGIRFVIKCIQLHSKDIIAVKAGNLHDKVDLAKEERLKKYDLFISEIKEMYTSSRIDKIKSRYETQEVGQLSVELKNEAFNLLNAAGGF